MFKLARVISAECPCGARALLSGARCSLPRRPVARVRAFVMSECEITFNLDAPSFPTRGYFSHHSNKCFAYLVLHRSRGRQDAIDASRSNTLFRRYAPYGSRTLSIVASLCRLPLVDARPFHAPCGGCGLWTASTLPPSAVGTLTIV